MGVFTRRNPESITLQTENVKVYSVDEASNMVNEIDVMVLCGGSATDLPVQSPHFAKMFNIVDSYDNHSQIPKHFQAVDNAAKEGGKVQLYLPAGSGPVLVNRLFEMCSCPMEATTILGQGCKPRSFRRSSQNKGVLDAKQYTIPVKTR